MRRSPLRSAYRGTILDETKIRRFVHLLEELASADRLFEPDNALIVH
jgi:hypothetical protein